jgi:protein regulator of cytokinesis 1
LLIFWLLLLDEPSEDLLTRHEDEAARLRAELASKHALLAKAQKWETIVGEQRALAAAAADQTRLTGRGVRGDPGRLLREEKMRKRVEREKPKVCFYPFLYLLVALMDTLRVSSRQS